VHNEKDFMHQANSGIDYVIARACVEKNIAIEFNFSNILDASGRKRAEMLARMAQNVRICRQTNCDMIITSGAKDMYGMRAPMDLIAFGTVIGMTLEEAKAAVSANPAKVLKRSEDRRNPDIILKGLKVKKWGSKPKEKKIYGWY
jgi:ribonuclease P/MRP protein subunit RPP1